MEQQQSTHPLVGQTLGERYEVVRQIGQGSMGAVFEARHVLLGRRLAIKVLKQDCSSARLRERFFNEARAAGAINHQHIVQVYDFGLVHTGEPFIVMEFVEGESLQEYMDRAAPLTHQDTREVVLQILSAIEAIHKIGLVHRDVKPANMMLVGASRPRLFIKMLDFGIARAVNEDWDWPTLTRADEVLGTPVYLSPEQASGGKADPRWDLWAVAIIMYEVLAGRLPFKTESLIQISTDIINHNITPLRNVMPGLPEWAYSVVERGLARDIDLRYADAADFLQALDTKKVEAADRKATMPGFQVPDATEMPDASEQPPELPPDVMLDEQTPPPGELKETDPVYLLQPRDITDPGVVAPLDDADDMKETMVQQTPPSLMAPEGTSSADDYAATIVAAEDQVPPGPYEETPPVPVDAQDSWSRGEAAAERPPPLTTEFTAEVHQGHIAPLPDPEMIQPTTEFDVDVFRRPWWLWALLILGAVSLAGVVAYLVTKG